VASWGIILKFIFIEGFPKTPLRAIVIDTNGGLRKMKTGLNTRKQENFNSAVKEIMGRALISVGAPDFIREQGGISEIDLLLTPTAEIADLLQKIEEYLPKDIHSVDAVECEVNNLQQRAAVLCLLMEFSHPNKGLRDKEEFQGKGRLFRKTVREAARRLWTASGEMEQPVFAPILFDDDSPEKSGLHIGHRFFHIKGGAEEGIDGLTPEISGNILEQLAVAKAGLRKAMGLPIKEKVAGLGVAPVEDWLTCIDRLNRMIKEERNS